MTDLTLSTKFRSSASADNIITFRILTDDMEIVFLGTGGGWPSKHRNVAAIAIRMGGEVVLLDCGEGTQRQFMFSPFSFMKIKRVLISHFHGDHFLGLPGLIQSMSLNKRSEPLDVFGPAEVHTFVDRVVSLGYYDRAFEVRAHEVTGGNEIDCGPFTISTAAADHGIPCTSYAIIERQRPGRFDLARAQVLGIQHRDYGRLQRGESIDSDNGTTVTPDMVLGPPRPGRKVVYTGDTRPTPAVAELARDADVLICDSTFAPEYEERGNTYGHFSSRQAALLAVEAGARQLVLTHISTRYQEDPDSILVPAQEIFENTVLAEDLMSITVPFQREERE